ncbi:Translation initiation factor SUI1 [Candidatus Gugararchaeum adminiculabundum]|nr:Translation initiation factor SUI1 [Candidatus Gugararchaeum adminiculabundum]
MVETCPKCGLMKDICACDVLEKEDTLKIKIYTTKKKFGKLVTIVEGLEGEKLEKTAKELKHKLATGGTAKDGVIVLQGNLRDKAFKALVALGYAENSIALR